jgi:hypothetical protein
MLRWFTVASFPSIGTWSNSRGVNASEHKPKNLLIHWSTGQFSTPNPKAIIPPVLDRSALYQSVCGQFTYLVPTIRSKNAWIGRLPPKAFSMALRTSSSTMPRTPPLITLSRGNYTVIFKRLYPSRLRILVPAYSGLILIFQAATNSVSATCNGQESNFNTVFSVWRP